MEDALYYTSVGFVVMAAAAVFVIKLRGRAPADGAGMSGREYTAGFVAIVLGAPLVYMFAAAVADGQLRVKENPVRAIIGAGSYEAVQDGDSPTNYVGNDRRAPDFTLRDRAGREWKLSDHRGKIVVMNFWTKTCRPCLEEMPSLLDLAGRLRDRDDVELVAITTDADWEAVRTIFPPQNDLEILFDPDSSVVNGMFGTRLFPETWFIDTEGIIRVRVDGPRDWSQPIVEELIDSLKS